MQLPTDKLRVDMAVSEQDIFPSVVVEVEKDSAKPKILAVDAQTCRQTRVMESAIAIIFVECRDLVREIGPDDVQPAISVGIPNGDTHSRHGHSILVKCATSFDSYLAERPVVTIVIKQAWGRVASDIDVRPTVIVEIGRSSPHSV